MYIDFSTEFEGRRRWSRAARNPVFLKHAAPVHGQVTLEWPAQNPKLQAQKTISVPSLVSCEAIFQTIGSSSRQVAPGCFFLLRDLTSLQARSSTEGPELLLLLDMPRTQKAETDSCRVSRSWKYHLPTIFSVSCGGALRPVRPRPERLPLRGDLSAELFPGAPHQINHCAI